MVALAALLESSTTSVTARSVASGIGPAAMIIAGIAAGDYVFIIIAIYV